MAKKTKKPRNPEYVSSATVGDLRRLIDGFDDSAPFSIEYSDGSL